MHSEQLNTNYLNKSYVFSCDNKDKSTEKKRLFLSKLIWIYISGLIYL